MSNDPVLTAVRTFAETVIAKLDEVRAENRELRQEIEAARTAPVPAVDLDAIDARIEERFRDLQSRTFADLYRGAYKPDEPYRRGDWITRDGGLWLAMEDSEGVTPGTAPAWKLIVKKGSAGE